MNATEYVTAGPLALGLKWNNTGLVSIHLCWSHNIRPTLDLSDIGLVLTRILEEYVRGADVVWPDLPLAWDGITPFRRTVLTTLRERVGFGNTVTYGKLAELAGRPGAARAVGGAMASNPWPLVIPCHRVLGSGGGLGGFSACGLPMKRALLGIEGVAV